MEELRKAGGSKVLEQCLGLWFRVELDSLDVGVSGLGFVFFVVQLYSFQAVLCL